MENQIYNGKTFLEYVNELSTNIRKISKMICGVESPEEGSLLGDVDYSIYIMIQMCLAPVIGKNIGDDDLNNLATEIMYADKDEIDSIIQRYCIVPRYCIVLT